MLNPKTPGFQFRLNVNATLLLARLVKMVLKAPTDLLVMPVHRAWMVNQDLKVHLDLLVQLVIQEKPDPKVHLAILAHNEMVVLVNLSPLVWLYHLANLEMSYYQVVLANS